MILLHLLSKGNCIFTLRYLINCKLFAASEKRLEMTEIAMLPKTAKFPNYQRYRSHILVAQIEEFNKDSVKMLRPIFYFFWEVSRQRALRSVWVELVHCFK